jgi:hypothetical protein
MHRKESPLRRVFSDHASAPVVSRLRGHECRDLNGGCEFV